MPTIGQHNLHGTTNEKGNMLIEFAWEKNPIMKSTYFQLKNIYKGTWRNPDARIVNKIYRVLTENDLKKNASHTFEHTEVQIQIQIITW